MNFIDQKRLETFLIGLQDFYREDNPELKQGMGHEIEHIKGVVLRTKDIVNKINEDYSKYNIMEPVNMQVAITTAALHDIGNTIDRSGHNFYSKGIVNGSLNIEDIILNNADYSYAIRRSAIEMLHGNSPTFYTKEGGVEQKQLKDCIKDAVKIYCNFEMAYRGKIPINSFENPLFNTIYIKWSKRIASETLYNPKLQEITSKLHDIFPVGSPELSNIAQACMEHNIDFIEKGNPQRFIAYNIYSNIIADADKDNSPEVFAIRTMLFTRKNFGVEEDNPMFYRSPLHQANERHRPSKAEYEQRMTEKTGIAKAYGPMPIFEESIKELSDTGYKPMKKYKGITFDVDNPKDYVISTQKGDDLYSQLDERSGSKDIYHLRDYFCKTTNSWADPAQAKVNQPEIKVIWDTFLSAKTIEEACAIYEAPLFGINPNFYSFDNVVKIAFDDPMVMHNGQIFDLSNRANASSLDAQNATKLDYTPLNTSDILDLDTPCCDGPEGGFTTEAELDDKDKDNTNID